MERDYRKDYEELISKLKTILDSQTNETISIDSIRKVIPELSESKDNIENRLINAIKSSAQLENCLQKHGFKIKEILNWLEKQIERKSDVRYRYLEELLVADDIYQMAMNDAMVKEAKDKATSAISKLCVSELLGFRKTDNSVRPKFKTGDWVMLDRPVLITKVEDMPYNTHQYWTSDGKWFGDATKAKLWTIQDAKDGDVLATLDYILIFKEYLKDNGGISYCHYDFSSKNPQFIWLEDKNWYLGKEANIHPATKEQRDLLFQKMKEAGYEWDAEKKELRTIGQKPADLPKGENYGIDGMYVALDILQKTLGEVDGYQSDDGILEHKCAINAIKKLYEQNPTWSEGDEKTIDEAVEKLEKYAEYVQGGNSKRYILDLASRVESLKDRIQPQPKQEWSEENEKIRKELNKYFRDLQLSSDREFSPSTSIDKILAWLEKQGKESDYNPYKATVESIAAMVEKYANGDLRDFYDNIKVKCKDAMEYDKIWLEKQGGQKPTDKVEPKFKVGDIISDGVSEVEIVSIDENKYNVTNSEIENDANICNWVVYFKDQEKWKLVEYKSYSEKNKKHLQSKQDWSEEDKKKINSICNYLMCSNSPEGYTDWIDWLKSLPSKINIQQKQKWSEEDEKIINDAIWLIERYATDGHKKLLREQTIDKLKSLKPNHWKPNEYDISLLEEIARNIRNNVRPFCSEVSSLEDLIENLKAFEL